jgi:formate dehydrogenase iron-sulfur subunit
LTTYRRTEDHTFRWDFHPTSASIAVMRDASRLPDGIVRTEFGGVFTQPDVCQRLRLLRRRLPVRSGQSPAGRWARIHVHVLLRPARQGLQPASATACPTQSIQFGEIEDLRERATRRLDELRPRGIDDAQLYDGSGGSVRATYAMFIFRGNPEEYNLPATPDAPTVHLRSGWRSATLAAGLMLAGVALAFVRGRRDSD